MAHADLRWWGLQARLLDSQKQALLGNRMLLLLAAQKLDAAGTALQALASRFPDYPRLTLLHAALLAQTGKVQRLQRMCSHPAHVRGHYHVPEMPAEFALAHISEALFRSSKVTFFVPRAAENRAMACCS